MKTIRVTPTAFDAFAGDYDDAFTHSTLGRLLRPRVWAKLREHFEPGQHVLELTCGTGEDALWLARQGVRITATDGSAAMIRVAEAKKQQRSRGAGEQRSRGAEERRSRGAGEQGSRGAEEQGSRGAGEWPVFAQVSLQEVAEGYFKAGEFDGVYSNFGGLNTIGEWRSLAAALAAIIRPGGKAVLAPMGPFCPWEIGWYLAHGRPGQAFRRWQRQGAPAKIGETVIPVWYPSARRLRVDFAPWFRHMSTESLELWLPPSYLDHFVNRWPNLFVWLNRFEQTTARLTGGWGDHYIIVFERRRDE